LVRKVETIGASHYTGEDKIKGYQQAIPEKFKLTRSANGRF